MESGHDPAIKATSSTDEAARELLQQSFCIFQSNPALRRKISRARLEALKVLDQPSLVESLCLSCHQVIEGTLHGYHLPSPAKRLFRAFPSSELQPWPNSTFKATSHDLAASLHELLIDILKKAIDLSESNNDQGKEAKPTVQLKDIKTLQKKRKRGAVESSATSTKDSRSGTGLSIPVSVDHTSKCPLDYFFYHNEHESRHRVNCSEHIDRGALICVCLSSATPGLEVLPRGVEDFVCPEAFLIHNKSLYEERHAVSGLICIMAGDQLGRMLGLTERLACVHRTFTITL
ncbi:MAG: hypothetical protein SGBAC_010000 [Bacillariaceae sp.]